MAVHSEKLAALSADDRKALEKRLFDRQSKKCFICEEPMNLLLQAGQLEIDHIMPVSDQGPDDENNFALVHLSCNRSKGASDLRVARRMAEFEKLQTAAEARGERGANLGHLLAKYGGALHSLRLLSEADQIEFAFAATGNTDIHRVPLYRDSLSGMQYFFAMVPLPYLHHDDRINPRTIGTNIRGLIEEFMKKRPQLHVALAWWAPDSDGTGTIKVFDGQHKAAAQILLGVKELPVRVFVEPDTNVLLQANTNAGDKLRQVAFDAAVLRHLGSTLYAERLRQYQQMKNLDEDDYSFSEKDLVTFFRGEHREMQRYIVDSVRDSINYHKDNRLREFVEWAGKSGDRPLAYSNVEKTFFAEFLYMKVIESPIDQGVERGDNPRFLERDQLVRVMSLFADIFFVGQWDPDISGHKLENRVQKGDQIPEYHLRAWRVAREEILANILTYVRLVIEHYYALVGEALDRNRLMQRQLPDVLWQRVDMFLRRLRDFPCWVDKNLSLTVFGAKQNREFWAHVFKTGRTPSGVPVLTKPIDVMQMIQESPSTRGTTP
jgi:hypothetical protein